MAGNSPQAPGVFGQRNAAEVLERRREREADIRPALYVGASGREFALARDAQNGATYVVANTTGKTYKPGSVVFLGSNTGHPPEVLLSGPPAGFGGASTAFFVPYHTPLPPAPYSEPTLIAYFLFDGFMHATYYYADGSSGALVGSATDISETISGAFVRSDLRGYVNDLCWLYLDEGSLSVCMFDPTAETIYRAAKTTGYQIAGVHYANGYAWWCDGEEVEHGSSGSFATTFRLRRANCDMTDVTTVGTFDFGNDTGDETGFSMGWEQGFAEYIELSAGLFVEVRWTDKVNHDISGTLRITWDYSGTQSHGSSQSWVDPPPTSDVAHESPIPVSDHPVYGPLLSGGAYALTVEERPDA